MGSSISEADPPLSEADVNVAFTAEVTRAEKVAPGHGDSALMRAKMAPIKPLGPVLSCDRKKVRGRVLSFPTRCALPFTPPYHHQMNYADFLTCLMKLSAKVFPRSRSKDEAFQRLLQDNILPLAARRCPDSVELFLENDDVQKLFEFYSGALEQIFSFYATNDKRAHSANTAGASAGAMGSGAGMGLSHSGRSPIRATRAINSMKEAMGYAGVCGVGWVVMQQSLAHTTSSLFRVLEVCRRL